MHLFSVIAKGLPFEYLYWWFGWHYQERLENPVVPGVWGNVFALSPARDQALGY